MIFYMSVNVHQQRVERAHAVWGLFAGSFITTGRIMRYISFLYSYMLHRLLRLNCGYSGYIEVFGRKVRRLDSLGCCCVQVDDETLYLRPCSTDSRVFTQIFKRQEYALSIDIYRRYFGSPSTIIDVGANVGLASRYFLSHFPDASVVCIEPHEGNFRILEKNMQCAPRATCIQCAVWSHDEKLQLCQGFRDGGEWAFQYQPRTNDVDDSDSEGRTLNSIMKELSIESIDILKIDIEGSEKDVVFNNKGFLSILQNVRMVVIEVHPECVSLVDAYNFFFAHKFRVYSWGETMNAVNERFLI